MAFTLSDCLAAARAVGFSDSAAQTACNLAYHESRLGSDTRCACQACCDSSCSSGCGPMYHDAQCQEMGLTGHCGIFQWSQDNPQWHAVFNNGCLGNLQCELQALFAVTNGGTCFGPWGPDVGQAYGYCNASGVFGGGTPGQQSMNTDSGTCDCPPLLFKHGTQCCVAPGGVGCVGNCSQSPPITPGGAAGQAAGAAGSAVVNAIPGFLSGILSPLESAGMFIIGIAAIFVGVIVVSHGRGGGGTTVKNFIGSSNAKAPAGSELEEAAAA